MSELINTALLQMCLGISSIKILFVSLKLAVKEDKYVYYDWNALNGDAEGYLISKDKLIARAKETIKNQASVIILMHDANVKTTTVDALPDIIEYLINSGYEFKTLDDFNN